MIDFENPAAFFLLLLIPVLYFLRYVHVFSHISFPIILSDWKGSDFKWNKPARNFFAFLARLLLILTYFFVVVAFAKPVQHHQEIVYTSRGSEVIFVVDISPSMAARDIGNITRLEAAQSCIRTLVEDNGGISVGLVEMAKDAALSVPPTMDRTLFFSKLNSLIIGELGDGTAIGNGLSCAILHLNNSSSVKKSIVLITDGENNSGVIHPLTAARLCADKGISLYVVGVGTKGIVPLEYADPVTGKVYSGNLDSNYDSTNLSRIAIEGNGNFYETATLTSLSQTLNTIAKSENVVQSYHIKNNDESYSEKFLFLALILLCASWFIRRVLLQEVL